MIIKIYFTRKNEKNLLTQFLTIAAQLAQLRHSNFCREKGFIVLSINCRVLISTYVFFGKLGKELTHLIMYVLRYFKATLLIHNSWLMQIF